MQCHHLISPLCEQSYVMSDLHSPNKQWWQIIRSPFDIHPLRSILKKIIKVTYHGVPKTVATLSGECCQKSRRVFQHSILGVFPADILQFTIVQQMLSWHVKGGKHMGGIEYWDHQIEGRLRVGYV